MRYVRGRVVAVVGLAVAVLVPGWVRTEGGSPLPGAAGSLEELGETAWVALQRQDTATMRLLRLTEREHNEMVWPELPASAPEANFPVDFAWQNIQTRDRAALGVLLSPEFRLRSAEYRAVECLGVTQRFESFRVLTDCHILLWSAGGPVRHQLFKDVLVMGGGYKIFRYYSG